ncbi:hypothetical protein [Rhodopirellula baltica]|uniref:hypothetical protein n=1 Tax=Rhodopirellula baltica TaxID=265606 RepID=UPI0006880AA6|nr:hypothetical protein [Rhodopirellula baltica]
MTEYKKSVEDDLDWSLLNQLHAVVLQIGTFCFHTKQICLTVLAAVVGLIATFTKDKLDSSVFVAGAVIPLCFWFLDSVAYFYQVKLRGLMDGIRDRIHQRHSQGVIRGANAEVISNARTERNTPRRLIDAFFNHSMWLYLFLLLTNCTLWWAFSSGTIK